MKGFSVWYRSIFSVLLLIVIMFGSVASGYTKSKSITKSEFSKTVIKNASASFKDVVFVNDALFIEVPVNNIGFHNFVYKLDAGVKDLIMPVAHAPPVLFT